MKLSIKELQNYVTDMLVEVDRICRKNELTYFIAYGTLLGASRHSGPIPWDADADIIIPYNELNRFIQIVRKELPEKFFLDFHDINKYYTATFPRIGLKGYSTATLHLDVFVYCGISDNEKEQFKFQKKVYKLRKMHYFKINSEKYRGKITNLDKAKLLFYRTIYSCVNLKQIRINFDALCRLHPLKNSEYITNPSGGIYKKSFMKQNYLGKGIEIKYANYVVMAPEMTHNYLTHFYGDYMILPPENEREIKDNYTIIRLDL